MASIFGALVPPVELVPVADLGPVHFIAAGGAGMAPIAELYAGRGVRVSGSDRAESANLARLRERGVRTHVGHAADQIQDARTVVVSSAIGPDNPEVIAAREAGLRIWHRSTALAALMMPTAAAEDRFGIAVGGTHGKTTTSGMVAHILTATGFDPGFVIGAPLATTGTAAADGTGPFVVEADESDGSFRQYVADIAIVTNIEADHLDNWETPKAYAAGFDEFAEGAGRLVLDLDDAGAARLAATTPTPVIGLGEHGAWRLDEIELVGFGARAVLTGPGGRWPLAVQVPGRHNLNNAALAIIAAVEAGVEPAAAVAAMGGFRGTARRFTPHGVVDAVQVFDDYAHHPTELIATLSAARAGVSAGGPGRVLACFQPHLYSRTRDFADEFGRALALADRAFITDIYGAREDPIEGVHADVLVEPCRTAGGCPEYVPREELAVAAARMARPGDVIITLGAGDITQLADVIVAELHRNREREGHGPR